MPSQSRIRPRIGLSLLVLSASAIPAIAAAAEAEAAGDPVRTDIVVIGTAKQLQASAGSGAIVSHQDIERSRVLSVNDALRQVAGLFPRDEEGLGARPNIGVRGLNPTRSSKVLLLEDGIPLSFAPYGDNASYYHPPIERFDRIEVLKGSSQVRFGPQTVGGVINYITPHAPDSFQGRLSAQGGNRDSFALDGQVGGPLLGGRVLLHANHKQSDGNRAHQHLRFTDIFGKGEWDLSPSHSLTVKASYFRERSDITYTALTRAEYAADPRGNPFPQGTDTFHADRWSVSAAHRWDIATGIELRTTAYYHSFDRDWWRQSSNSAQRPNDASDPACGGMANLLSGCGNEGRLRSYRTWGIESRLTLDHRDALGLGIGGATELGVRLHREDQRRLQLNGDSATAREAGTSVNAGVRENNRRKANAVSLFAQSSLEFGALTLTPGVRAEFIDYRRTNLPVDVLVGGRPIGGKTSETSGQSQLDKVVPGIGASLKLGGGMVLYGGVHRGFAPPRVEDIITTGGGTVDLDAELSWNWEAGIRGDPLPGLHVDAAFFVMDFSNQIVPQSVAGGLGATLTSAGRTLHRGGELSLSYSSRDAGISGDSDFYGRVAATWVPTARYSSTRIATAPCFDGATTGTLVQTGAGAVACGVARDIKGNRLPYSSEWLVSAAVGFAHKGFTGQVEVVGQSAMFADDVNLIPVTPDGQRGRIDGWAMVNLAFGYGPPGGNWEVFATLRNVFDRLVVVDRSRGIQPGNPRMVQGGVTFRF